MEYGKYDTWYDKAHPQHEVEEKVFCECESCGEDIEIDLSCLDDEQFFDVPSDDGGTERICRKCYDSWVNMPDFRKQLRKLCAVKTDDLIKEALKV